MCSWYKSTTVLLRTIPDTICLGHRVCPSSTLLNNAKVFARLVTTIYTIYCLKQYIVQFSRSVVSDSLWPHELQHARPPCASPSRGVCPSSCPLNQWCHLTISSSVAFFSLCLQSFWALEYFQMSQLFSSGGQSVGASASASVLPMNIQGWFPLGWTGVISLLSKGLSRVFSSPLMYVVSNDSVLRPSLLEVKSVWLFCSSVASVRGGRKIAGNAKN